MSSKDVIDFQPAFTDPLGASIGLLVVTEAGLIGDFSKWLVGSQTNPPDRVTDGQLKAASYFGAMSKAIAESPFYTNDDKAVQLKNLYEEIIKARREAIETKFPYMLNDEIAIRRLTFLPFASIINKKLGESQLHTTSRLQQLKARTAINGISKALSDKYLAELSHDLGSVVDEHKRQLPHKRKNWRIIRKQPRDAAELAAGAATAAAIVMAGYVIQQSRGR